MVVEELRSDFTGKWIAVEFAGQFGSWTSSKGDTITYLEATVSRSRRSIARETKERESIKESISGGRPTTRA